MDFSGLTRRSLLSGAIAATGIPFVSAQQENSSETNYFIGLPLESNWESRINYDAARVGGYINDTVYIGLSNFGNSNGELAAIDINSGRKTWSIELSSLVGRPFTDEKNIYVTSKNNIISIDSNTESTVWESQFNQGQSIPYLIIQGNQILGASRGFESRKDNEGYRVTPGELVCLNKDNGNKNWTKSSEPVTGIEAKDSKFFATIGNNVFDSDRNLINTDGSIHAYETKSGELLWTSDNHSLTGGASARESYLVGFANDGTIYGFNYSNGNREWDLNISDNQRSSILDSDLLYIGHENGEIIAVDTERQSILWKNKLNRAIRWIHKYEPDNILYLGSPSGNIRAVDSTSGKKVWSHTLQTDGVPYITVHQNIVFFFGAIDSIYTFVGQRAIAQKNIDSVESMVASSVLNNIGKIPGQKNQLSLAKSALNNREYEKAQGLAEDAREKIQTIEASGTILGGISVFGGASVAIKKAKERSNRKEVQQEYDAAVQRANDIQESVNFDIELEPQMIEANPSNFTSISEAKTAVNELQIYLDDIGEVIREHRKIEERMNKLSIEKNHPDIEESITDVIDLIRQNGSADEAKEKLKEASVFLDCYELQNSLCSRLETTENITLDLKINKIRNEIEDINISENPSQTIDKLHSYESTVNKIERIKKLHDWNSSLPLSGVIIGTNRIIDGESVEIDSIEQKLKDLEQIQNSAENIEDFTEEVEQDYHSINIEESYGSIEELISRGKIEEIEYLEEELIEISESTWVGEDLFQYSWEDFEHLISRLWSDMGYSTTVTQASSDRGIDVIAENSKETILIQVKQNSTGNDVGRPTVQKTAGALSGETADRAIIITSSSFTNTAVEEANRHGNDIVLISGQQLLNMLNDSKLSPPK